MNDLIFFENASLDALLAAFANAKPHKNGQDYVIESSYKENKFVDYALTTEIYEKNNQLISDYFGLAFKLSGSKHQFIIHSTLALDDFFQTLYQKILQKRALENISDKVFERKILLAFFALRGSADFKLNFYSLDLLSQIVTERYLDNLFRLLTNIQDLRQLNLNFREFQKQFVTGENQRNTQFRINLRYFFTLVGQDLKMINQYKFDALMQNQEQIKQLVNDSKTFIERLLFYKQNVLKQFKTEHEIEQLRKELGFDKNVSNDEKVVRNTNITGYAKIYLDDECVACKDTYSLDERTFKYRNSDRYYLEIHHCISFSSDNTCDQIDNLVKLCPACHRALTPRRAEEDYQLKLIQNILKNAPKTKEFCLNFTDEEHCIDFIYDRLR